MQGNCRSDVLERQEEMVEGSRMYVEDLVSNRPYYNIQEQDLQDSDYIDGSY